MLVSASDLFAKFSFSNRAILSSINVRNVNSFSSGSSTSNFELTVFVKRYVSCLSRTSVIFCNKLTRQLLRSVNVFNLETVSSNEGMWQSRHSGIRSVNYWNRRRRCRCRCSPSDRSRDRRSHMFTSSRRRNWRTSQRSQCYGVLSCMFVFMFNNVCLIGIRNNGCRRTPRQTSPIDTAIGTTTVHSILVLIYNNAWFAIRSFTYQQGHAGQFRHLSS